MKISFICWFTMKSICAHASIANRRLYSSKPTGFTNYRNAILICKLEFK